MLELKKGADILMVVGEVKNRADARKIINEKLDDVNKKKLARILNKEALIKIANAISLCKPESVLIDTGSGADLQWVREYSLK